MRALPWLSALTTSFPIVLRTSYFPYLSLSEKEFPEATQMFESPMMDRAYFNVLTDQFRSPHLWYKEGGEWKLRSPIFQENNN
jgi:hypothetical protein